MNRVTKFRLWSVFVLFATIILWSCEEQDLDRIIISTPNESLAFQNNFADRYDLDVNLVNEIALNLQWNSISWGNDNLIINHRVQASTNENFSSIDFETIIQDTNFPVSVGNLFSLAELKGLDSDPATTYSDGSPNNVGQVYYRVSSFLGSPDAVNTVMVTSDVQQIRVELMELSCEGGELSQWGMVGPFNSWTIGSAPVYAMLSTNSPNVFKGALTIDDQGFKISVLDGSFSTSYAFGGTDGVLIIDSGFDPLIPSSPGHYMLTADLQNLSYTIEETKLFGLIGPATPNGWDGPNHKFVPDDCLTGVYIARNVPMVAGDFFIRVNDDWTESYSLGDDGEGSFKENPGIGSIGMPVSEDGNYDVILDFNDSTYSLIKL